MLQIIWPANTNFRRLWGMCVQRVRIQKTTWCWYLLQETEQEMMHWPKQLPCLLLVNHFLYPARCWILSYTDKHQNCLLYHFTWILHYKLHNKYSTIAYLTVAQLIGIYTTILFKFCCIYLLCNIHEKLIENYQLS